MSNRLSSESSLYLRQHAENPVDWWPWGDEAFGRARAEDKPVLVSIGYSSCHWCHVMAHECFEDDFIARLMNQHFICIKVDREERPDIDQVFMETVQMVNQHGGWPLNVFCLPDGQPFYGGTYFPPEDRGQGLMPWPQLLMRIAEYHKTKRSELEENAGNIVANLRHLSSVASSDGKEWQIRDTLDAARSICASHDDENGGFGGAPKFPPTMVLQFLLTVRQSRACGNEFPDLAARIDHCAQNTLTHMARGGLFDQVGGGFCRYCVDAAWTIPHFEKMLYDNALLLETFSLGWSHYRNPLYAEVVEDTIAWLERDMRLESGLYAASVDADSPEGEGKYYCWQPNEIRKLLDPESAELFLRTYRVTAEGNFEENLSYPQFDGSLEDRQKLAQARKILLNHRQQRPAPPRDDKVLTFWNALLARALVLAGSVFERKKWILRAREILDALWENCRDEDILLPRPLDSGARPSEAFLDDYATLAHALVLLSARRDVLDEETCRTYLGRAEELTARILEKFPSEDGKSYHFTSADAPSPLLRRVEWYDNATPAGNSTLVHLFAELDFLTGKAAYGEALRKLHPSFAPLLERVPNGIAYALAGWTQNALGMATVEASGETDLRNFSKAAARRCWRPVWLRQNSELPTANWRICVGQTCLPPSESVNEAAEAVGFPPRRKVGDS